MSGHMFFGGDYLGFDDALFAAARLLEVVSNSSGGLSSCWRRPA
jgi:phosphomannomutase